MLITLLFTLFALQTTIASEPVLVSVSEESEIDQVEEQVFVPDLDPASVERLGPVTEDEIAFLEPKHHLHEQNPYGQTDFTAYTLEWGEVKIGLASITAGLLPRTQIGTVPLLDLLGVPNVNLKVNALRAGPVDVAILGSFYTIGLGEFRGTWLGSGAMASVRIAEPLSFHFGGDYVSVNGGGFPDPRGLPSLLTDATGTDLDDWEMTLEELEAQGGDLTISADIIRVKAAMDYRLNRRDSFVFQFSGMWRARASGDLTIPLLNFDEIAGQEAYSDSWSGASGMAESYMVTVSYQATFKKFDLRLGGGKSGFPLAWLLQANDLSFRFGGETRWKEARENRGWRADKREL
jgi:hypothetical protein